MKKLWEFFEENNGQASNMRLLSTILVLTGCYILIYSVMSVKLDSMVITAASLVITIGIGGKVAQKDKEQPGAAQ